MNKIFNFLVISILLIGYCSVAFAALPPDECVLSDCSGANLRTPVSYISILAIIIIFPAIIEMIAGYLIFFRHEKKSILMIALSNVISGSIFFGLLSLIPTIVGTGDIQTGPISQNTYIALSAVLVIVIEAFLLKFLLKEKINIKRAFLISIVLNLISFGLAILCFYLYDKYMATVIIY